MDGKGGGDLVDEVKELFCQVGLVSSSQERTGL